MTLFHRPTLSMARRFLVYLVHPLAAFSPVSFQTQPVRSKALLAQTFFAACFYGSFLCLLIEYGLTPYHANLQAVGGALALCAAVIGASWRWAVRSLHGITGDMVSDVFAMGLYPCVAMQLVDQMRMKAVIKAEDDDGEGAGGWEHRECGNEERDSEVESDVVVGRGH